MKYAIDRIENNVAILEDINTKEKKEVPISELPKNIKEGNILEYIDYTFKLDNVEETLRRERIINKFNRLKK